MERRSPTFLPTTPSHQQHNRQLRGHGFSASLSHICFRTSSKAPLAPSRGHFMTQSPVSTQPPLLLVSPHIPHIPKPTPYVPLSRLPSPLAIYPNIHSCLILSSHLLASRPLAVSLAHLDCCNACTRYVCVRLVLLHALYYVVAVLVFKVQG